MGISFTQLIAFNALLAVTLSCSCFPSTFEKRYCSAPVSIRGKILDRFDNCPGTCDAIADQGRGRIYYFVEVIRKYKGNALPKYIFLTTAVNGALCGINLQVGGIYLLNLGNAQTNDDFPGSFYSVGLCNFPTLWKSLSKAQRKFVKKNAKGGAGMCRSFGQT